MVLQREESLSFVGFCGVTGVFCCEVLLFHPHQSILNIRLLVVYPLILTGETRLRGAEPAAQTHGCGSADVAGGFAAGCQCQYQVSYQAGECWLMLVDYDIFN